jgi:ABC-type branched-subunit amino acid transport system ATPase component
MGPQGVNPTLLNRLLDRIRELQRQGKTFVIVEHDVGMVMNLCEKILVLDHGEKTAEGFPSEIQSDERVIEAYYGK